MAKAKLVMATCYDASFARICGDVGSLDYLLVGDSMGMVIDGEKSTLGVTLDQMARHVTAVRRGLEASSSVENPKVVGDMPVGTYENDPQEALKNAQSLMKAGADMVKLEGPCLDAVRLIVAEGIPVCGHIGLTPQSIQTYKVQGKDQMEAERLKKEARDLEAAGCALLVLEMLPRELAKEITDELVIPTIGIGAGPDTSGQVLVLYDLLGFNPDFKPKFLKQYSNGYEWISSALKAYSSDVRKVSYPSDQHSFH